MSETPDWLVVGAEVAELDTTWRGYAPAPVLTTIAKIGKRDVVLANGNRFNVNRLRRNIGGAWGRSIKLLPASDPEVTEAMRAALQRRMKDRALGSVDAYRKGECSALDVVLSFAPLTAFGDEIRCAVGDES